MKVLQIHNKYKKHGGEDVVLENENQLLRQRGVEIKQIIFSNVEVSPFKLFYNKSSYRSVKTELEYFKPDVIHVHNIFYNASPSIFKAAKEAQIPVVMTLHNFRLLCTGALFLRDNKLCTKCKNKVFPLPGVIHKCFKDSYSKSLVLSTFIGYNKLINTWDTYIDKFIVLTPFIKDLILSSNLGLKEGKVVVKPNSTDDLKNYLSSEKRREGFLFIGRLSIEKGVDRLIKAFNKLPKCRLEVIGTGDLYDELKSNSNSNIIFYGKRDKSFINNKLSTTKALIVPSIWYEGLPNTILEAYSSGTPVLSSNLDNINQIVIDGYNGMTFDPDNIDEMIDKIKTFDTIDITKYCTNARKTFKEKYTHDVNYEALTRIYSETIITKS